MPEHKTLSVELYLFKENKNTVRYDVMDLDDLAPIDSLYLKKFTLNGVRPEKIEVVITLG